MNEVKFMEVRMENKIRISKFDKKSFFSKENLPLLSLIILGILAVAFIVVSHVVFDISIIVACAMVVLEALLASCLNKIPLWVHGLVFIAQIVGGIIAGQIPFMAMMDVIYVGAIAFLFIWEHHE